MKAEMLRAMLSAGCSAEQIVAAAEIEEAAQDEKRALQREQNAERQRRFRERRNANNALHGVTPVTSVTAPSPDKEKSPTPPKEINPIPSLRSETKRGARLPVDWVLPAGWGKWALDEGYSEATIRIEADKFRDFWCSKPGKDAAKLDWQATWRNWIRNAPKGRNLGTPLPKPKSDFMQHQDDVQRELDKALGRNRNDEFTGSTLDLDAGNWRAH